MLSVCVCEVCGYGVWGCVCGCGGVRWCVCGCHVCELMVCVKVCKGTFVLFLFVCFFIFITCRFGAGVRETCEKVHLHQLYNIRNETLLMGKYIEQRKYTLYRPIYTSTHIFAELQFKWQHKEKNNNIDENYCVGVLTWWKTWLM